MEEEIIINPERKTTIGDVVTIQCILCMIMVIGVVVLNIFKPESAEDIFLKYKVLVSNEAGISELINMIISVFE